MNSKRSLLILQVLTAFALVSFAALPAASQDDPDPNSPTPILISQTRSTRALAVAGDGGHVEFARIPNRSFDADTNVTLFVTNLTLMPDEGANAFRVYASDIAGHQYRFPVVGFTSSY